MFLLLLQKVQLGPPIFPRRVTPKHPSLFQGVKPRLLTSSRGSVPSASSEQPSSSLPSPACSPAPEGIEDGPPSGLHNKGVQEDPPRVPDLHDEGVQVDPPLSPDPQQQFHHRLSKLH
ncbi:hypothetical protein XENOCAPTIV_030661 [Xenoophorus captivus]|uniref:Uncharacterized protein n=1 Tax=Xenoophorus captivus TaxID=1517983 RepID=A0ABV0QFE4_9TELE